MVVSTEDGDGKRLKPFVYFVVDAPINQAKLFCTNRTGTVAYGVTLRLESVFNELTQMTTHHKEEATVCRLETTTGQKTVYNFEDRVTVMDCRTAIDCYMLDENVIVLVCHNRQRGELSQMVFYLCGMVKKAIITYTKTKSLVDFTYDIVVGQGLLPRGQVAVIGTKGPFDGEREVVAQLIAANPMKEATYPDVNLTKKIQDFRQYLKKYNTSYDIFQKGIFFDNDGIYFLIKKDEINQLVTKCLGKLIYKPNGDCDYELLQTKNRMEFDGGLSTRHLLFSMQSGKSLWLGLDPPNFTEMLSLRWRFYYWWLPKLLTIIIKTIELAVWLRRFDGGWSLHRFVKLLLWWFGPGLMPVTEPDPVFHLYHLDLERNVLRRAAATVPVTTSLLTPFFNIAADVDATGGLMLCELTQKEETVKMNYYHCPMRPPSLAWLATHRAYRLFPAFEKSPPVRRMLGQTEFIY